MLSVCPKTVPTSSRLGTHWRLSTQRRSIYVSISASSGVSAVDRAAVLPLNTTGDVRDHISIRVHLETATTSMYIACTVSVNQRERLLHSQASSLLLSFQNILKCQTWMIGRAVAPTCYSNDTNVYKRMHILPCIILSLCGEHASRLHHFLICDCRPTSVSSAQRIEVPSGTDVTFDCQGESLDLISLGGSVGLGSQSTLVFRQCFLSIAAEQEDATTKHSFTFHNVFTGPSTARVVLEHSRAEVQCEVCHCSFDSMPQQLQAGFHEYTKHCICW